MPQYRRKWYDLNQTLDSANLHNGSDVSAEPLPDTKEDETRNAALSIMNDKIKALQAKGSVTDFGGKKKRKSLKKKRKSKRRKSLKKKQRKTKRKGSK